MIQKVSIPLVTLAAALLAPAAAWAQSGADPTGEPPIGVVEKSNAKGPSLTGVLSVELVGSDGFEADAARMVLRLRRGSRLETFFASIDETVFFDTDAEKEQLQADVLEAFRLAVLGKFFPDECGVGGDLCPAAELVLKKAEEFGLTDDGTNQFVMLNVVVATTTPL